MTHLGPACSHTDQFQEDVFFGGKCHGGILVRGLARFGTGPFHHHGTTFRQTFVLAPGELPPIVADLGPPLELEYHLPPVPATHTSHLLRLSGSSAHHPCLYSPH